MFTIIPIAVALFELFIIFLGKKSWEIEKVQLKWRYVIACVRMKLVAVDFLVFKGLSRHAIIELLLCESARVETLHSNSDKYY